MLVVLKLTKCCSVPVNKQDNVVTHFNVRLHLQLGEVACHKTNIKLLVVPIQ